MTFDLSRLHMKWDNLWTAVEHFIFSWRKSRDFEWQTDGWTDQQTHRPVRGALTNNTRPPVTNGGN